VQITTISLRNYRVFRDLELEMPPGLVGIYGANGSGKSTLLESVLWALYGRARTGKGEIRSAGETGECVVELGFEHESHHYLVRRSISGANATVKSRVLVGGDVVADGITDVGRYIRSTLGMDETAFRSSVFAEQKQLAAFSDQTPDQRRRLVLQLLGIIPVEKARDQARADFRARQGEHSRLQTLLGPFEEKATRLTAAREQLSLELARTTEAGTAAAEASVALDQAEAAVQAYADAHRLDQTIRQLGTAARKRRDEAQDALTRLTNDVRDLDEAQEQLDALNVAPSLDIAATETVIELLVTWRDAQRRLDELGPPTLVPETEPEPTANAIIALRETKDMLTRQVGDADGVARAAATTVRTAKAALDRSGELADQGECPLCGQELREGAEGVRRHRQAEHDTAVAALAKATGTASAARLELEAVVASLVGAEREHATATKRHQDAAIAQDRTRVATGAVNTARAALGPRASLDDEPTLRADVRRQRELTSQRDRLRERVLRRPAVELSLTEARAKLDAAEGERGELRSQLDALHFDAEGHRAAQQTLQSSKDRVDAATERWVAGQRGVAAAEQRVSDAEESLKEAEDRETQLRELAEEARYLGRTADLLGGFRHAVVGLVGPQLSTQASELFNDLTNGDYDGLKVDPETYEIKVIDAGVEYPGNRFSGSEVDLANLALRVAISEQIRFQAGGQVGLLVLDEALASLDGERKDRMLAALTRLSGRFRQILVVTHAPEVKERLPQAIEVIHLGGRRSTARVLDQLPFG
jgi:DNA repair protein SbcC/Rad50